jgi:hypothetical protein
VWPTCLAVAVCVAALGAFAEEKKKDPLLDRPMADVDLGDVSVEDAVNFMQDVTGAKIDWTAMRDAGIDPATGVTFKAENTTIGKALKRLFLIAGADAEPDLSVVEKNTIVVKPAAKKKG